MLVLQVTEDRAVPIGNTRDATYAFQEMAAKAGASIGQYPELLAVPCQQITEPCGKRFFAKVQQQAKVFLEKYGSKLSVLTKSVLEILIEGKDWDQWEAD